MVAVLGCSYIVDAATTYASYWLQQVLAVFQSAGFETYSQVGNVDTLAGLTQALQQHNPVLVIFAGHGNEDVMTGAGEQPMIMACQNDQVLAGTSVSFIACLTGVDLCPSIVSKGGVAAQGFVQEFQFVTNGGTDPSGDVYAASFGKTLTDAAATIARGGSWADWLTTFRSSSMAEIAKWNQSTDPMAPSVVNYLTANMNAAIVAGAGTVDTTPSGGTTAPAAGGSGIGLLVAAALTAAVVI